MLLRTFREALMSISKKHKYKTFTESSPASLSHCMGKVLNHSSGKCRVFLTIAALKKMTPIRLLVFHLVQTFGRMKGFVNLLSKTILSLSLSPNLYSPVNCDEATKLL